MMIHQFLAWTESRIEAAILLHSNRSRLNKQTLEISRGVFLATRVNQDVPNTLVGQPTSRLEGRNCRFTGGGNWPMLSVPGDNKDHRFLRSTGPRRVNRVPMVDPPIFELMASTSYLHLASDQSRIPNQLRLVLFPVASKARSLTLPSEITLLGLISLVIIRRTLLFCRTVRK
jgi:hypothetical protein